MKNAFIFDMDGTLGETIPLAISASQTAYKALGLAVPTRDEITAHFGPTELGLFRALSGDKGDALFEEYLKAYKVLHLRYAPCAFDGIGKVIEDLRSEGAHTALVTGKSEESARISLEVYGFEGLFDEIGCGGLFGTVKTSRILEIAKKWRIDTSEIWYVGDSPQDILDTRNAGAKAVSVAWSKLADANALEELKPDLLFRSVEDFSAWARSLKKA